MIEIGRNKYKHLKSLKELTEKEQQQVREYEKSMPVTAKLREYGKKLLHDTSSVHYYIKPKDLILAFKERFKQIYQTDYVSNPNIEPLVYYFCRDERFFKFVKVTEPSFKKGLLLIGGFGNGKSSSMAVFESLFYGLPDHTFKTLTANEVVDMYEQCDSPHAKKHFWGQMTSSIKNFDDVKTERQASNYGKANIFKDIIEKRYALNKRTYMTCNYTTDLEEGLAEFGEKYGGRVYDRLFEMCNVIEFTGKSFRR